MKYLKKRAAALLALLLSLAVVVGTFGEALPAEETAGLFGSPWVNSMVTGNLPETAPEEKDDFYTAVNYDYLTASQAAGMSLPLAMNGAEIQASVMALLQDESLSGNELDQLKIFWEQAADMEALREDSLSRISPYLERIAAAASIQELNEVLTAEDFPFSPYLAMPVAPLALNEENGVWIFPALALTSDYSNGANSYSEPVEDAVSFQQKMSSLERVLYIPVVLSALGVPDGDTAGTVLDLFNTEVAYVKEGYSEAKAAASEYGFISSAPQRMTMEELGSQCSRFPLAATLARFGKDKASAFVVPCPGWLKELDHLWTDENLDRMKLLTQYKVLMEVVPFLSPEPINSLRELNQQQPLDAATNPWFVCNRADTFGHLLAKLYTEKVLGNEMKDQLTSITRGLIDTYRTLIEETEWLSAESRANALEKLDHMRLNVLEPDGGYIDFSGLKLTPSSEGGSLLDSYLTLKAYLNETENALIGMPAKADLPWKVINPLTTNCFYDPFSNSVNLLPGFLFSWTCPDGASEAQVLGGLGTVIGHEISHAFDYAGSQCDAYGLGNPILTEADREVFLEKVKAVENYYDNITVLPGVNCRGTSLRVENTADLAGLKAAAALAKARGLDLKAFFQEYARIYAMAVPQSYQEILNNIDTHAPAYLRVNVNVQMADEFYEAFDVQEGDGMYVKPEDRLTTWGK